MTQSNIRQIEKERVCACARAGVEKSPELAASKRCDWCLQHGWQLRVRSALVKLRQRVNPNKLWPALNRILNVAAGAVALYKQVVDLGFEADGEHAPPNLLPVRAHQPRPVQQPVLFHEVKDGLPSNLTVVPCMVCQRFVPADSARSWCSGRRPSLLLCCFGWLFVQVSFFDRLSSRSRSEIWLLQSGACQ